jgi:hypothetical protein
VTLRETIVYAFVSNGSYEYIDDPQTSPYECRDLRRQPGAHAAFGAILPIIGCRAIELAETRPNYAESRVPGPGRDHPKRHGLRFVSVRRGAGWSTYRPGMLSSAPSLSPRGSIRICRGEVDVVGSDRLYGLCSRKLRR